MPISDIGQILSSTKQIGGTPTETAVLKAFLMQHVDDFDRVQFEVGLGPGIQLGPEYPDYMVRYAAKTYQLRADMICWRGNVPTIVEAKDRLDGCAIGQLLTYTKLLKQDNPTLLQTYKVAVGLSICEGIRDVFWEYGVEVELFPWAEKLLAS